jgi:hypothetical protein
MPNHITYIKKTLEAIEQVLKGNNFEFQEK